jgi:hypothetical protein
MRKCFFLVVKSVTEIDRKHTKTFRIIFLSVNISKHGDSAEGGVRYTEVQYYRL